MIRVPWYRHWWAWVVGLTDRDWHLLCYVDSRNENQWQSVRVLQWLDGTAVVIAQERAPVPPANGGLPENQPSLVRLSGLYRERFQVARREPLRPNPTVPTGWGGPGS